LIFLSHLTSPQISLDPSFIRRLGTRPPVAESTDCTHLCNSATHADDWPKGTDAEVEASRSLSSHRTHLRLHLATPQAWITGSHISETINGVTAAEKFAACATDETVVRGSGVLDEDVWVPCVVAYGLPCVEIEVIRPWIGPRVGPGTVARVHILSAFLKNFGASLGFFSTISGLPVSN
jgi:hypothetical protein